MSSLVLKKQVTKEVNNAGLAGCVEADAIQHLADAVREENQLELVREVLAICQAGACVRACVRVEEGRAVAARPSCPCACMGAQPTPSRQQAPWLLHTRTPARPHSPTLRAQSAP